MRKDPIKVRIILGRMILGSAASISAAAVLIWTPGLSPLAIAGLGAVLGIVGYQTIELWLRRYSQRILKRKDNDIN